MSIFLARRWRQQPQGLLTVDRGHALSSGLCAAWHPAASQYIGPGASPFPLDGTYADRADQSGWFGVKFNGVANARIALPAGSAGFSASYSGTRLVLFRGFGNNLGLVSGTVAGTLGMRLNGGVNQIALVSASNVVVGIGNVPTSTAPTTALCTSSQDTNETRLHINGTLTFSGSSSYTSSNSGIWVGAITNHSSDANFFLALSWDRALSISEAAAIQENPWQIFKPQQTVFYSLPGTLFSALDETSPDRADYIKSNAAGQVYETTLSPIQQPTGNIDINFDAASPADTGSIKFELLDGTNVVKSQTVSLAKNVGFYLPRRWSQQPSYSASLNTSNSLTDGIIHAGTPLNCVFDAVENVTWGSSTKPPVGAGRSGLFWASTSYLQYNATSYTNGSTSIYSDYQASMWIVSVEYDTYTGAFAPIKGPSGGDNSGGGIGLSAAGNIVYQGGYQSIALDSGTLVPLKKTSVIVFTSSPSGSAIYLNGKKLVQSATVLGFSNGYYKQLNRLGYTDAYGNYITISGQNYAYPVFTYGVAQWVGKTLSESQVGALSENPWQIFKPQQRRIVSVPRTVDTSFSITPSEYSAGSPNVGRFLPRRWRQQPITPVRFQSDLMRPTALWIPSSTGMVDTAGSAHAFTRAASGLSTMVTSSNGYVLRGADPASTNNASGYETNAGAIDLVGKTAVTMFAVVTFHPSALFRNAETVILRTDQNSNIVNAQLSLGVFPSIKTIRPLAANMAWTASTDTTISDSFEANTPYLIVGHIKAGEYVSAGAAKVGGNWTGLLANNASFVAGASIVDNAQLQQTHIGGSAYQYIGWWGDVLLAGILPYSEKSNSVWQTITTNPWQIFKPNPGRIYGLPSTGVTFPWSPKLRVTSL